MRIENKVFSGQFGRIFSFLLFGAERGGKDFPREEIGKGRSKNASIPKKDVCESVLVRD